MKQENYAMLCDFYEFTMSNGYFRNGFYQKTVYFDVFFRDIPDGGGFAIAAGLEQVIDYVKELHFTEEDVAFLRSKQCFDEGFLTYLKEFHFSGDIWAVPEGTPVFPNEPIMTIRAPAIEAQLLETFILLSLNHQSLIATKANRIVRAADGRTVHRPRKNERAWRIPFNQPLTAPMVTPSIKYFCSAKNRMNMGGAEMVAPAIIGANSVSLANLNCFRPT